MFADLRLEIVGGKLKVTKLQSDVDGENLVIFGKKLSAVDELDKIVVESVTKQ